VLPGRCGGELHARIQGDRRPAEDQASPRTGRVPGLVQQLVELSQAGLGSPLGEVGRHVLAEHAEQPPHLGQRGPRGVSDGGEPLRPGGGHPGGGEPRALRLHGDDGDVVGDHIVELARDARPLAASGVLDQRLGDDFPRRPVLHRLLSHPRRDPRQGGRRGQRGQQHGQDPSVRTDGASTHKRKHQERDSQPHGQQCCYVSP